MQNANVSISTEDRFLSEVVLIIFLRLTSLTNDMHIPKVEARALVDYDNFTAKVYVLDSWADLIEGAKFVHDVVYSSMKQKKGPLTKHGKFAIGFTFNYDAGPTLDLFMLKTPVAEWSEIKPIRIRGHGPHKAKIQVLEDLFQFELHVVRKLFDLFLLFWM